MGGNQQNSMHENNANTTLDGSAGGVPAMANEILKGRVRRGSQNSASGLSSAVSGIMQQAPIQQQAMGPPPAMVLPPKAIVGPRLNPLYKTRMCEKFEKTGACNYGEKCQFAHGQEEMDRWHQWRLAHISVTGGVSPPVIMTSGTAPSPPHPHHHPLHLGGGGGGGGNNASSSSSVSAAGGAHGHATPPILHQAHHHGIPPQQHQVQSFPTGPQTPPQQYYTKATTTSAMGGTSPWKTSSASTPTKGDSGSTTPVKEPTSPLLPEASMSVNHISSSSSSAAAGARGSVAGVMMMGGVPQQRGTAGSVSSTSSSWSSASSSVSGAGENNAAATTTAMPQDSSLFACNPQSLFLDTPPAFASASSVVSASRSRASTYDLFGDSPSLFPTPESLFNVSIPQLPRMTF